MALVYFGYKELEKKMKQHKEKKIVKKAGLGQEDVIDAPQYRDQKDSYAPAAVSQVAAQSQPQPRPASGYGDRIGEDQAQYGDK
jgi:hypothetical protein